MNETGQDYESAPRARPGWRQLIGTGAWVLTIVTAVVITSVLPKLAAPVGVVIAGLGLLANRAKR
jgi:hypothetical protein